MEIFTNGVHNAEFLLSPANGDRSFERVVVPAGQGKLVAGTLLKADNTKAVDGADAVKVLYGYVDATDAAVPVAVVARDAEVFGEFLGWEDDTTDDEKLLAAESLAAAGIVVRWTDMPIASGDATQIEFFAVPSDAVVDESAGSVVAYIKDAFGAIVSGFTGSVTLTLSSGSGTLTGGGAVNAVAGVATWDDISFDTAGTVQVTAASTGLTSAVSDDITVAAA